MLLNILNIKPPSTRRNLTDMLFPLKITNYVVWSEMLFLEVYFRIHIHPTRNSNMLTQQRLDIVKRYMFVRTVLAYNRLPQQIDISNSEQEFRKQLRNIM